MASMNYNPELARELEGEMTEEQAGRWKQAESWISKGKDIGATRDDPELYERIKVLKAFGYESPREYAIRKGYVSSPVKVPQVINPKTGLAEYKLPSGETIKATPESKAYAEQKYKRQISQKIVPSISSDIFGRKEIFGGQGELVGYKDPFSGQIIAANPIEKAMYRKKVYTPQGELAGFESPFFGKSYAEEPKKISLIKEEEFSYVGAPGIYSGKGTSTGQQLVYSEGTPKSFFSFIQQPVIFKETRFGLQQRGMVGKVAAEFLPTSLLDVGLTIGTIGVFRFAPPIARVGLGVLGSGLGFYTATRKELPTEKRIAGGIIGGLGLTAIGLETYPYIKGAFSKVSLRYSPITTKEIGGYSNIKVISKVMGKETFDIALIPEATPLGRTTGKPAFVKGAFGFSYKEQQAFIGKESTIISSQIGFLKGGKGENVALNRMFFGTPSDIKTGLAQTRISRLGLIELFKFPGMESKLGIAPSKPQLLAFEKQRIGKNIYAGFKGGFAAKGIGTSELEVTTLRTIISGGKIGVTSISGQAVDIYSASLGKPGTPNQVLGSLKNIKGFDVSSYSGITKVPAFGLISGATISKQITSKPVISISKPSYIPKQVSRISPQLYEPSYKSQYPKYLPKYKNIGYETSINFPSYKVSGFVTLLYKPSSVGVPSIFKIKYPKLTEGKYPPIRFGGSLGLKVKIPKMKISRKYFYQPGVMALSLGLKALKVPKFYGTGLVTRWDVPKYRIKGKEGFM